MRENYRKGRKQSNKKQEIFKILKFIIGLFRGVRQDFVEIDFVFVIYSFYDKKSANFFEI